MNSERLTVRISSDLRNQVRQRAKAAGTDESEVVRLALEQYVKPPMNAYEAFKRAGLIGIVKNGVNDRSTNKKHMEGFGLSKTK
jgi:metal-responsive CopG/Arc/MetJ family transcriptional regulator